MKVDYCSIWHVINAKKTPLKNGTQLCSVVKLLLIDSFHSFRVPEVVMRHSLLCLKFDCLSTSWINLGSVERARAVAATRQAGSGGGRRSLEWESSDLTACSCVRSRSWGKDDSSIARRILSQSVRCKEFRNERAASHNRIYLPIYLSVASPSLLEVSCNWASYYRIYLLVRNISGGWNYAISNNPGKNARL